jgi:transposase InsO family protein
MDETRAVRQRDMVLRTKLRAFHAAGGQRYGRPNLWKDLQEDGAVSEKRVARLMQEEGIRGKVHRRFKNTMMSDHADPIAPAQDRISGGSATPASSSLASTASCISRRSSTCIRGSSSAGRPVRSTTADSR